MIVNLQKPVVSNRFFVILSIVKETAFNQPRELPFMLVDRVTDGVSKL